jgi:WD40 repeat protein
LSRFSSKLCGEEMLNFKKQILILSVLGGVMLNMNFAAYAKDQYPLALYKTLHLAGDNAGTLGVAWSSDSQKIAVSHGTMGGWLSVYDVGSGKEIQNLEHIGFNDGSLFFLPDEDVIVTSITDPNYVPGGKNLGPSPFLPPGVGALSLWDFKEDKIIADIAGPPYDGKHRNAADKWAVSKNGLMAASSNVIIGDAALYSLKERVMLHNFNFVHLGPESTSVASLALSPDGKLLAIGTTENKIYIYDTSTYKLINITKIYPDNNALIPIKALAFSPDSEFLAAGLEQPARLPIIPRSSLSVWKVSDLSLVNSYVSEPAVGSVTAVSWSPEGQSIAFTAGDHSLRIWSPGNPEEKEVLITFPKDSFHVPTSVSFSPDGKYVAVSVGTDVQIFILPNL